MTLTLGCAFSPSGDNTRDSTNAPVASPGETATGGGTNANTTDPSSTSTDQNTATTTDTSAPLIVSGAFLVCEKKSVIQCVLSDASGNKLALNPSTPTAVKIDLFSGATGQTDAFTPLASTSSFDWQLAAKNIAVSDIAKIDLHLEKQQGRTADFQLSFNKTPVRFGDGTNTDQSGCTADILARAVTAESTYTREVTLTGDQTKVMVTITKLCGVTAGNTDSIKLMNGSTTIKEDFLPVVQIPTDKTYTYANLVAGTYKITFVSRETGSGGQLDDFAFADLMISQ